ncbi:MAG TPA: EthD domain-containing protein [Solimonas sp.]|nr:EthD domain-containing protein [Solimonas sp.]
MEKIIYTLWKRADDSPAAFADSLRTQLSAQLLALGVRGLQLNIDDADVAPAAGIRQIANAPLPDALLQVWLDSAITLRRAPVDAAIGAVVAKCDAYLVTESVPLRNQRHPPASGQRTHGFAQIALLVKPPRLGHDQWLANWHDGHTPVAIETQSTFEYRQNVVVRALTPGARPYDAIVEECFPPEAMSDPHAFFDAVGDPQKFQRNLDRMMASVGRFLDLGTIDVLATSQYCLAPPA